jgi:hypothetical protein
MAVLAGGNDQVARFQGGPAPVVFQLNPAATLQQAAETG